MRLIDHVVTVDEHCAVAQATVKRHWPMVTGEGVNPMVLIEMAAQTAGVCIGWRAHTNRAKGNAAPKGWLVGVKQAMFYADWLPLEACITIHAEVRLTVGGFREIIAAATMGETLVGEVHLQVLQDEGTDEPFF